jgi:SAM-dependent methyltransferase
MPHYDLDYVAQRYDAMNHSVSDISFLRAGFVLGACDRIRSVLDVGYGSGGFLAAMNNARCFAEPPDLPIRCVGTDISGYPVPKGCEFLPWDRAVQEQWDLVTFFDSLEHFPTLQVLHDLKARWIVITAPWVCEEASPAWLAAWKHLRPGEHLHHFKPSALCNLMEVHGYRCASLGFIEDMIRKPSEKQEHNTFTAVFASRAHSESTDICITSNPWRMGI